MLYRVRYRHQPSGELARTYPMTLPEAKEMARQLVLEGEEQVELEDEQGDAFNPSAL